MLLLLTNQFGFQVKVISFQIQGYYFFYSELSDKCMTMTSTDKTTQTNVITDKMQASCQAQLTRFPFYLFILCPFFFIINA